MSKWKRANSYSCGSIVVDGKNLTDGIRWGDCQAILDAHNAAVKELVDLIRDLDSDDPRDCHASAYPGSRDKAKTCRCIGCRRWRVLEDNDE